MAAVTVTRVAVCPCSGAALQVAAGGSAVDGAGPVPLSEVPPTPRQLKVKAGGGRVEG